MPEGYGDIQHLKDLRARKEELDSLTRTQTENVLGTGQDKSEG
jgi:hypothetical protein